MGYSGSIYGAGPATRSTGGGALDEILARRAKLIAGNNPELDASTVISLAGSNAGDAEINNALADARNTTLWKEQAADFNAQDDAIRRSVWAGMPESKRQLYLANGATPPAVEGSPDKNWFDWMATAVAPATWALQATGHTASQAVGAVANAGGNLMGWLGNANDAVSERPWRAQERMQGDQQGSLRGLQLHAARAAMEQAGTKLTDDQWNNLYWRFFDRNKQTIATSGATNKASGLNPFAAMALDPGTVQEGWNPVTFNPAAKPIDENVYLGFEQAMYQLDNKPEFAQGWAASWGEVAHGEHYIDPYTRLMVQAKLGKRQSEGSELAIHLGEGKTVADWVREREGMDPHSDAGLNRVAQLQETYYTNPDFVEASKLAAAATGKTTLGRSFADALSLETDSKPYTLTSGATDFLFQATLDPTLAGGKAFKAYKGVKWAIRADDFASDVSRAARLFQAEEATRSIGKRALNRAVAVTDEESAALVANPNRVLSVLGAHLDDAEIDATRPLFKRTADGVQLIDPGQYTALKTAAAKAVDDWVGIGLDAEQAANPGIRAAAMGKAKDAQILLRVLDDTYVPLSDARGVVGRIGRSLERDAAKQYGNAAKRIASAMVDARQGGEAGARAIPRLLEEMPHLDGAIDYLNDYELYLRTLGREGIEDWQDVFNFYQHQLGARALGSGGATASFLSQNVIELPRWTAAKAGRRALGNVVADGFDFARSAGLDAEGMRKSWVGYQATRPVRALGKFVTALTHQVPRSNQLLLSGPNAVADVQRLFDMGAMVNMPKSVRQLYLGQFIRPIVDEGSNEVVSRSIGMRNLVVRDFLRDMFDRAGIADAPEGVKRWADDLSDRLESHKFAPGDLDVVEIGGRQVRMPVFPSTQWSAAVEIPDFRVVAANMHRLGFTNRFLARVNNPMVDAFMGTWWKPSMLLRLGFLPRAMGEEALAFVSRHGLMSLDARLATAAVSEHNATLPTLLALPGRAVPRYGGAARKFEIELAEAAERNPRAVMAFTEAMRYRHQAADAIERSGQLGIKPTWKGWMNSTYQEMAAERAAVGLDPAMKFRWSDKMGFAVNWWTANMSAVIKRMYFQATSDAGQRAALELARVGGSDVAKNIGLQAMWEQAAKVQGSTHRMLRALPSTSNAFSAVSSSEHWMMDASDVAADTAGIWYRNTPYDPVPKWLPFKVGGGYDEMSLAELARTEAPIEVSSAVMRSVQTQADDVVGKHAYTAARGIITPQEAMSVAGYRAADNAKLAIIDGAPSAVTSPPASIDGLEYLTDVQSRFLELRPYEQRRIQAIVQNTDALSKVPLPTEEWITDWLAKHPTRFGARTRQILDTEGYQGAVAQALFLRTADGEIQVAGQAVQDLVEEALVLPRGIGAATFSDATLRIGTAEDVRADVIDSLYEAMFSDSARRYINDQAAFNYAPISGGQATTPLPENTRRFYSLMADKTTADEIEAIAGPFRNGRPDEIMGQLKALGATDNDLATVRRMLIEWDSSAQRTFDGVAHKNASQLRPLQAWGFTNHADAERIAKLLERWSVERGSTEAADQVRAVTVGMRDMADHNVLNPDEMVRMVGTPADDVPLDAWRIQPQAQARMRTMTDTRVDADGNIVEGMSREDVFRERAEHMAEIWMRTHTHEGRVLNEWVEPVVRGTENVSMVRLTPLEEMPQSMIVARKFVNDDKWFEKLYRFGFDRVFGTAMDSMVRAPMFNLALSKGLDAALPLETALRSKRVMHDGMASARAAGVTDLEELRDFWWGIPDHLRHQVDDVDEFRDALGVAARNDDELAAKLGALDDRGLAPVWRMLRHDEHVEQAVVETAFGRAVSDTVPFIDDHNVRSFFQVYARNIMPFQFAQEAFLKRWARTLVYAPESMQRAQLLINGFRTSGFVHKNDQGEEVYTIPLTGELSNLLARTPVLKNLWGGGATIPIEVPLTGELKSTLPGIPSDFEKLPSLGPIAYMPLQAMRDHYPELHPLTDPLLGSQSSRDPSSQLMPAWMRRALGAMTGGGFGTDRELNNATIGALQQMEAEAIRLRLDAAEATRAGRNDEADEMYARAREMSPPEDGDPIKMQQWVDHVADWGRANLAARAFVGFFSPAQPQNEFPDAKLAPEFKALLEDHSIDEALAMFLTAHPEGSPYTVFLSQKDSGAPIPPTQEAHEWMTANRSWMEQFPLAAPWMLPQSRDTDDFSRMAYNDQLAQEMRRTKKPDEWYADYKFAVAAQPYFAQKEVYDRERLRLELTGDKRALRGLDLWWDTWADQFKARHPAFESQLTGAESTKRTQAIEEMRLALGDPNAPDFPHKQTTVEMLANYDAFTDQMSQFRVSSTAKSRDAQVVLKDEFSRWGEQFIVANPEMETIWRTLFEPAAGLRDDRVARQNLYRQLTGMTK